MNASPAPRRALALAAGLGLAAAAAGIAGCSNASVLSLDVGDCLHLPESNSVVTVATTPCSDPHQAEVSTVVGLDDGDFPGDAALNSRAETACVDGFQDYVASPYVSSALDVTWLVPTRESWAQGDRQIICLVRTMDAETLTRSVKGSGL
ncbi:septum formation family protein [Actinomyces sp. B33]|uniref:septum formation family protein n=1 Tax=Actinomyces sp. B33 TaxID=2942131 RepID=UPI0023417D75|nr:septum formation family protein [Actinomyces sp. B33]MDC4232307.1 septum formation family protein [Actinomyces sp. B33]